LKFRNFQTLIIWNLNQKSVWTQQYQADIKINSDQFSEILSHY